LVLKHFSLFFAVLADDFAVDGGSLQSLDDQLGEQPLLDFPGSSGRTDHCQGRDWIISQSRSPDSSSQGTRRVDGALDIT